MKKVLIIDDELAAWGQSQIFRDSYPVTGFEYLFAEDEKQAARVIKEEGDISLILLDIRFEGKGATHGLVIIEEFHRDSLHIPIIMMSSQTQPDILIRSWDLGAHSYIVKWADNPRFHEELKEKIERYSLYQNQELLLGSSPKMLQLKQTIHMLAEYDTNILIEGKTGTGKELVAQSLHQLSKRSGHPMIAVHCGAIPESLAESELFGHVRGAFTGANADKKGKIEEANGGILFLDEIGEMTPGLQVKLLRFLDNKQLSRVGEARTRDVDVRIVSATNRDLEKEVEEGRFRDDLYYRLNGFRIESPPLRDCIEDIPLLANHFLELLKNDKHKPVTTFSSEVIDLLQRYHWPGNVRELQKVVERAFIVTPNGEIQMEAMPESLRENNRPLYSLPDIVVPERIDIASYSNQVEWSIMKAVYLDELKHGVSGIKRRVAERVGLHAVNGFTRKVDQILQSCPHLAEDIQETLERG